MSGRLALIVLMGSTCKLNAQEIVRFEGDRLVDYQYTAQYSENATAINQHALSAKFGSSTSWGNLRLHLEANQYHLDFKPGYTGATDDLEDAYKMVAGFRLRTPVNPSSQLEMTFTPELHTLFSAPVRLSDIIPAFALSFRREGSARNSDFAIGITYTAAFGRPLLLPYLRFSRRLSNGFGFELGTLRCEVYRTIQRTHGMRVMVYPEGFYATRQPYGEGINKRFDYRMQKVSAAGQYDFRSEANWEAHLRIGYSFIQRLESEYEGEAAVQLPTHSMFFANFGFNL